MSHSFKVISLDVLHSHSEKSEKDIVVSTSFQTTRGLVLINEWKN